MTFPNIHRYLTVHWTITGVTGETGQFGLRFDSVGAVDQDAVDACAPAVSTMWASSGGGIEAGYKLSHLRLAQIDVNGNYVTNTISYDHIYAAPVAGGGGTTTARFPLQSALASTLVTAVPRGQASKGRIYLPWINTALGSDAMYPLTAVNNRSAVLATMIGALESAIGNSAVFSKGTKTSTTGAKNNITGVKTGTRPDVQRRRAKQISETYGTTSAIP